MPIMMQRTPGGSGPILVCDYCGERITDANMGNYEWDDNSASVGDRREIILLHKGCSAANEAKMGVLLDSMELIDLLPYLASNSNIDWEQAKEHADMMSDFF